MWSITRSCQVQVITVNSKMCSLYQCQMCKSVIINLQYNKHISAKPGWGIYSTCFSVCSLGRKQHYFPGFIRKVHYLAVGQGKKKLADFHPATAFTNSSLWHGFKALWIKHLASAQESSCDNWWSMSVLWSEIRRGFTQP